MFMSSTLLKTYETEALQFSLKLDIGLHKKHDLLNIIKTNYRHTDSDFDKGFTRFNHIHYQPLHVTH